MNNAGHSDSTLTLPDLLKRDRKTVSTAESCTGGLIAKMLTDTSGSSLYFKEGMVTYANESKIRLLGVKPDLLDQFGAVSPQVAVAMAIGCRAKSGTDYTIAVTGIAGPSGGSAEKPVGLVYIALADHHGCEVKELRIDANQSRDQIRQHAALQALEMLKNRLSGSGLQASGA